jgi:hypothetical protein
LQDVRPIDDVRSTAEYRRRVTANLVAWLMVQTHNMVQTHKKPATRRAMDKPRRRR